MIHPGNVHGLLGFWTLTCRLSEAGGRGRCEQPPLSCSAKIEKEGGLNSLSLMERRGERGSLGVLMQIDFSIM